MSNNPSTIARETLLKLAELQLQPTPDNYHKIYSEIEGVPDTRMSVSASKLLASLVSEFPRHTKELAQCANKLSDAVQNKNWQDCKAILLTLAESTAELEQQQQTSDDPVKKNTTVDTDDDPTSDTKVDLPIEDTHVTEIQQSDKQNSDNGLTDQLVELLAYFLEHIASVYKDDAALSDQATTLMQEAHTIQNKQDMLGFVANFKQFISQFEYYSTDNTKIQQQLLRLVDRLLEGTGQLLSEDEWFDSQIGKLRETISRPLNKCVMFEAESYLTEILQRQQSIKSGLNDTRKTLKKMMTCLIDNIEGFSDETSEYSDKIDSYSEKVGQADDLEQLSQLLVDIMEDTQKMRERTQSYQKEFESARADVDTAQQKIVQLESELQEMGEKVHEDHMTGVLNRRGLDFAFEREIGRAERQQLPICYALLDIDNFKALNDQYGHKVGDDAIIYLVNAVQQVTRSDDVVARYGGEEFVILLPNTCLKDAVDVLSRIRRDMTKQFFLHENKKIVVTFSAGVAEYEQGESQEDLFKRADEALYRAKKNGKNLILEAA